MIPAVSYWYSDLVATEPDAGITPRAANPAMIGVPLFVVGSVALALQQVGFVSADAGGAPLATILMATGLGTLVAALRRRRCLPLPRRLLAGDRRQGTAARTAGAALIARGVRRS